MLPFVNETLHLLIMWGSCFRVLPRWVNLFRGACFRWRATMAFLFFSLIHDGTAHDDIEKVEFLRTHSLPRRLWTDRGWWNIIIWPDPKFIRKSYKKELPAHPEGEARQAISPCWNEERSGIFQWHKHGDGVWKNGTGQQNDDLTGTFWWFLDVSRRW